MAAPSAQPKVVAAPAPPAAPVSSPNVAAEESAYPVRWSDYLRLSSLSEIGSKLASPGVFGELAKGDHVLKPKTCVEWQKLHAEGYEAASTLEEQPDNGAKLDCDTLRYLENALPAKQSFVRDLKLDKGFVNVLPASLATAQSREQEAEVAKATSANLSLKAFDPKLRVKKGPFESTLEIVEGSRQSSIVVKMMAWGDFNADGLDDIVLAVDNDMTYGSASSTRIMVVTRSAANQVLHVLPI